MGVSPAQGYQHDKSYRKLSLITLNLLVLVLGKLSRRLAAFMVAALASPSPSGKAWLGQCPVVKQPNSSVSPTHRLRTRVNLTRATGWGQLVCWWFWARSATLLLCRCYFGPAWLQQRQGAVALLLLLRCLVSTRSMPRYVTLPSSRLSLFSSFKTS